ncbi:MAG: hypothetical protein QGH06_02315 [Lutibacter sp.]|nr:hypothetical protein [Lutibacter sp.]
MVTVKSFRAYQYPRECKTFIEEHTRVLERFDIANITSAKTDWAFNPHTVIVTIRNTENEMVGGGRIQVADGLLALPIEEAVGEMDPNIYPVIERDRQEGGTGEFCGLWNTPKAARLGIGSLFLMKTILSVCSQLDIQSLYGLCAPSTVKNVIKLGAIVQEHLGNKGTFYYPKLDLLATALKIPNVLTLEHTDPKEKAYVMRLRTQPSMIKKEILRKKETQVCYDLLLKA